MKAWYNIENLNRCIVYTFFDKDNSSTAKYIMFGPDLSKFKKFDNLESVSDYATRNNLIIEFK